MRMITKAGLTLLVTAAAAAGAPSASANTTCITAYALHVGGVCVDYNTDDPSVRVYGSVFTHSLECDNTLNCDHTLT